MARDSFEIYYFQNGRWSVHASYEANERDVALAEAQKVDKTLGFPVRLVRETFYSETNTSEEVVSWQSAKAKQMGDADNMFGNGQKQPPQKKPQKAPPAPTRRKEAEPPASRAPRKATARKPPTKKKTARRLGGLPTKLAIVVSRSLFISAIVVGAMWTTLFVMIEKLHLFTLSQDDTAAVLAGLFVVSYVISAIYYLFKQFNIKFGLGLRRKPKVAQEQRGPSAADMIRRMQQAQVSADTANKEAPSLADVDVDEMREHIAQEEAEEIGDRSGDDDFATAVHQETQAAPPAVAPPPEGTIPPPGPPPAPPPPPEPPPRREDKREERKPPEKPPEASAEAEARQGLAAFTRDALAAATREQPELNAFTRFGMNLYIAGACSAAGQAKKLGRAAQLTMLRDSLQSAGNSPERAETFCAELPSHGKNQRYASMIQAGSAAMTRQLRGQPSGAQELTALLADWSKPEKRPSVPSAFTFLFTDIVNSTALTSQLGNAGAQRVVRAHNTAVRGAIQAQGGREVKHTGDGIMATFPTPHAAVQGAVQAQKEITAYSAANPATAFAIRIGINVGEAVEEDNDFFGAAVQMTARICSVATPANVWVSRAVVDACKGQRLGFIPRGAFQMKGIQQARPLYEVAYTDAHKNEIANL